MNSVNHIRKFIASFGVAVEETDQLTPAETEQFRGLITSQFGVSHEVAMSALQHLDALPPEVLSQIVVDGDDEDTETEEATLPVVASTPEVKPDPTPVVPSTPEVKSEPTPVVKETSEEKSEDGGEDE